MKNSITPPSAIRSLLLLAVLATSSLGGCVMTEEGEDGDGLGLDQEDDDELTLITDEQEVSQAYYYGVTGGYLTYCWPTNSTTGCTAYQTRRSPPYTDRNGNTCRDTFKRNGTVRFSNRSFSASGGWIQTYVVDCR